MNNSSDNPTQPFPDTLTERIGILIRQETEARILAPVIAALGAEFGRERVIAVVAETIVAIAQQQGDELAKSMGGCGSAEFLASLQFWQRDDALKLEVLTYTGDQLDFNVTRCRYAEMYRALGIPELGAVLSCNRDFALINGFNSQASLVRSQTIMDGASHCDFRYQFPSESSNP